MKDLFGIVGNGDKILFADETGEEKEARILRLAGCNHYLVRYDGEHYKIPAERIVAKISNGGCETRI